MSSKPDAGRPRIHETAAARKAASRERQQLEAAQHAEALEGLAHDLDLSQQQRSVITAAVFFLVKQAGKHGAAVLKPKK